MLRKTFFVALISTFAFCAPTYSQTKVGVKAGGNYSNFGFMDYRSQPVYVFSFQPGFHVGGTFTHHFDNWMAVRAELLFNQKGSSYQKDAFTDFKPSLTDESPAPSGNVDFYCVSVPLLLQVYPSQNFRVSLGGEISIRMNEIKAPFKRFQEPHDIGFLAEFGYDINKRIGVSFRYVHGLNPVIRTPVYEAGLGKVMTNHVAFNRCYQISVDYDLHSTF